MGWNGSGGGSTPVKPKVTPKKPSPVRGLVAGVVVVALAVVAYFAFFSGFEKPQAVAEKKKPTAIKEVKPAPAPKAKPEPVVEEKPKRDPAKLERARKLKAMTPEERIDFLFAEAAARPIDLEPTTNRPFKTSVEISMARIFTTQLGDMPPLIYPVPIDDEAHLAEIIIANNPIIEGDSEKVKEAKQMVELAKKELKNFIKEGGDIREFLTYYHGKLDEAFQERNMCQSELIKLAKQDPDIAQEYCDKINEKLNEKGIKPLVLTEKFKTRWGIQ